MTSTEVFQRARSPEQKAQRRAAILDAAARLGASNGVRRVSLGDIARSVGLTKSNVLRYFETREDIYLQLTAAGYRDWATRVTARLNALDTVGPADIAAALAEGLAEDTLFCDLVSEGPATLEHNVSADVVRAFKSSLFEAVDDLAALLSAREPGLDLQRANQVIAAASMLAAGLWPWCNPPPVLAALYTTDPEVVRSPMEFVPQLRQLLEAIIVGLLNTA
ncbi:MAG TPA: TetR family transcriptional regulator [Pseudonocardia sp.]|nr:TetR family transcriptional regulator [Pseudonocardia sp.]